MLSVNRMTRNMTPDYARTGSGFAAGFMRRRPQGPKRRQKPQTENDELVGVRGFEPPTPASRTQYSTRLSYTPN